ncbi:hypothetical protein F0562_013111 [Nyssa sinensis]|uniref:BZIP domain-containing protein n=1 Tax=Nyssa sinensis TaxID=561372 RepID=A0A5J4ZXT8_9ASTE|nr:hypothetical protein F0562_013111 [Nyssa sinensis]
MNVDELIKNVISADGGQFMHNPSSPSASSASIYLGNSNLNGPLSKKTIDETWKEIVHQEHVKAADNKSVQQQLNFGETTLEDFLIRAGVVNVGNQEVVVNPQPLMPIDPMVVASQQADWLQFQMEAVRHQQEQQMTMPIQAVVESNFQVSDQSGFENPVVDVGFPDNQLALPMPMLAVAATSPDSQVGVEKKRKFTDEMMEKTIERRQKRMIKNRESAARSRARKQAYTNQLEHEVFQLRRTNNWLKKQKEVEKLLNSDAIHAPRYQLRRTSSAVF